MRASRESRKKTVLYQLAQARAAILEAARALPAEKQYRVFLGEWSPADLLAHLVGWDHANAQAAQELLAGQLPSFYAHHDRGWRSFNATLVARHRRDDFRQLLDDVERSHQALLDVLAGIPASEMVRDGGVRFRGWRVTIERLMLVEARDEQEHAAQLREWGEA